MPIGNAAMDDRTYVEWDKDDLDALGILKIDVLGLGMLSCLRKALDLVERHYGLSVTSPRAISPPSFRGANAVREPGIHTPQHRGYGFRVRGLTAAPRNDVGGLCDPALPHAASGEESALAQR